MEIGHQHTKAPTQIEQLIQQQNVQYKKTTTAQVRTYATI
jgi:hypothetical protein